MADWFTQNAPATATAAPPAGDWFAKNAPAAPPPAPKAPSVTDEAFWRPSEEDPSKQGLFRSFYDGALAPIVGMVIDTVKRGDVGAGAAQEILSGFADQVKNFAAHPDLRNVPIVGPGASATAARMQRQYDAGNYAGVVGSAAGFLAPFVAPEVGAGIIEKLPAAAQAAVRASDSAGRFGEAATAGVKAGAKAAAPDVLTGAGKAAIAAAAEHFIPGGGELTKVAEYAGLAKGGQQVARGLREGYQAGSAAYGDVRAAQAARDAAAARAANPRVAGWQQAYADAEAARAADAARPPTAPMWEDARAANAEREASAAGTETQPPAGDWFAKNAPAAPPPMAQDFETAPDARETLTPEMQARAAAEREASHAEGGAPAVEAPAGADLTVQQTRPLTPQEQLEDAIHQHAAYLHMQAEHLEWGNRARQADRYAEWFIKNGVEPTPENLQRAAEELEPRAISKRTGLPLGAAEPPSDETVPMIQDRVDWHRAQQDAAAAAPPSEGDPVLLQQLEASIQAVKSKRGQQAAAAQTGHVEGEVPVSGPAAGNQVDAGRTGGGPALPASGATGAGTQGERTAIDVPGEQRTYPAKYTVKELSEIQPSHHGATFQPNPEYGYKNDRLYDDPRNQRKIVDWSTRQGFNPRNLLNTAPTSEIGPPIVDSAGNVLGGNGRSMIMQRVYDGNPEGAAAYRAELDRTAHHYGIAPESYAHMKQPVLVRELDPEVLNDPEAARRAITDFNKTGTAALTPAERALADARGVSQRTLDDIAARMDRLGPDATLAQTVEGRQGIEILGNLERDGVISPQEGAELATETKLTRQGKERVSGLMLGRFFTDAKQMDALPDSLRNKLERVAAPLARAESAAGYSLQPVVRPALDLLEDAEAHGAATLDDYIRQQGLFGDREYSPEAIAFAKALKSANPVELTHAARRYAERAKYAEGYQGPGMFGDIPAPLPPREAFHDSFEHLNK